MDEQLPLFDAVDYTVTVAARAPRRGRATYRRLTRGHTRLPCDDCILLLHTNAWVGPAPLPATWVRGDAEGNLWLCHPHVQEWQLIEARAEQRA